MSEAIKSSTQFGSFTDYKRVVLELATDLKKLRENAEYLGLLRNIELIDDVSKRIADNSFSVAIVGEFKRGKSTLINALLGKDILPSDILPTTATLNRVTYGITPFSKIIYKDGREEEVPVDKLTDYVTKLTDQSARVSSTVKEAIVYYPVNYCLNNVDIIDTPGLNDDQNMTDVTLSVLPKVDASIMVIMAQSPFSEFERDFLENKLLINDMGRIMFIVSGIDRCEDEEEAEKVLSSITRRIEEYVLLKAEKTYGKDSEEFAVYRRKLGKIKVFGISGKQALKGKIKGDNELLAQSRFPVFEKELEKFLTEDRGAIFLQVPTSRILGTSAEILKTIELIVNSLSMQKEEFDKKSQEANEELVKLKGRKAEEMEKIQQAANLAYKEISPLADTMWSKLENAAIKVIDNISISSNDVASENVKSTQARIIKKVNDTLKNESQFVAELIQKKIEEKLQYESIRLQDFSDEVAQTVEKIQTMFTLKEHGKYSAGESIAAAAAVFTGLGGVWSGYRYAGVKGALVGAGASIATAFGGGMLLGLLSIPVAWPALLAIGVVSIFTGGKLTQMIFGGSQIEKFRSDFKVHFLDQLKKIRSTSDFQSQIRSQVYEAFESLKSKVSNEVDTVIEDTQRTFMDIKAQIERGQADTEQKMKRLSEIQQHALQMIDKAQSLNSQIAAVLDK